MYEEGQVVKYIGGDFKITKVWNHGWGYYDLELVSEYIPGETYREYLSVPRRELDIFNNK